jgi:hypothetical protein
MVMWHSLARWTGTACLQVQRFQFASPADWWGSISVWLSKGSPILGKFKLPKEAIYMGFKI